MYGNQKVFFEYDGRQVKGEFASDGNYYDKDNGHLVDLPVTSLSTSTNDGTTSTLEGERLFGAQNNRWEKSFSIHHGFQIIG